MDLLPDDVVADILGRLPPCGLAASRCVRRSWRGLIDARRLLRADLLPLRLDGFFCLDDILVPPPYFFLRNGGRRHGRPRVRGRLDFLGTPMGLWIVDHCNGLLLLDHQRVVNPATRQWVGLPPSPDPSGTAGMEMEDLYRGHCLVYDPFVSPHYEVVLTHLLPRVLSPSSKFSADSEWPPSPYATHVFSSRSWRWEERSFVRQGVSVGTIADLLPGSRLLERHSVYLRGKLYVHCENHSVMRINLSNDRFRVIKCPTVSQMAEVGVLTLGKSEKGVYSGVPWNDGWPRLRVWFLDESREEQMEWVLKSSISLQAVVQNFPYSNDNIYSSWAVTSGSGRRSSDDEHAEERAAGAQDEELEWDSDDGALVETKDDDDGTRCYHRRTSFLGFHPNKEIAFFWVSCSRVVSYHLNTSNVQDLGTVNTQWVSKAFPYTSCWVGDLRENNNN